MIFLKRETCTSRGSIDEKSPTRKPLTDSEWNVHSILHLLQSFPIQTVDSAKLEPMILMLSREDLLKHRLVGGYFRNREGRTRWSYSYILKARGSFMAGLEGQAI